MVDKLLKVYKKERLIVVDLVLLNLALFLSFILRFDGNWFRYFDYTYLIVISIIGLITLAFSNLYNRMWRYASIAELSAVLKDSIIINFLFISYIFIFQLSFPRSIVVINGILDVFFLGGLRFLLRLLKDYLICNKNFESKTRVLLIGAGDAAEMIIREMQKHPELKKEIIGLIDDAPDKRNLEIHGKRVMGNRSAIPRIIEKYQINEIIIAIPSAKGEEIKGIYNFCKQDGVKVKIVPGIYEILNGNVNLSQIREVKVEDLLRREQVNLKTAEISAYLEGKIVLVTGGGGSIGSELCRQVAKFNPAGLIIYDIYENTTYFLELELRKKYPDLNLVSIIGSIRDRDKLWSTFAKYRPDVVFHAAAHKHVPLMEHDPEEAIKNNVLGTKNVIEAADIFEVKRFVLISTDKAVNPTNVMGATKRVAEMIVQSYNKKSKTRFMAVRFGNVLGSSGSVIPIFKRQIASGGPVTITHPEITRFFMTIPEAAQLVIQAGALGNGGEVFVLDMGEPVKIIDLARDLIRLSRVRQDGDIDIEITGLRPGEKLYEELLNDHENNLATGHERIFITKLEAMDEAKLNKAIIKLEKLAKGSEPAAIINTLVNLVGTYQPKRDNLKVVDFKQGKILKNEQKEVSSLKKQGQEVAAGKEE